MPVAKYYQKYIFLVLCIANRMPTVLQEHCARGGCLFQPPCCAQTQVGIPPTSWHSHLLSQLLLYAFTCFWSCCSRPVAYTMYFWVVPRSLLVVHTCCQCQTGPCGAMHPVLRPGSCDWCTIHSFDPFCWCISATVLVIWKLVQSTCGHQELLPGTLSSTGATIPGPRSLARVVVVHAAGLGQETAWASPGSTVQEPAHCWPLLLLLLLLNYKFLLLMKVGESELGPPWAIYFVPCK